MVKLDKFEIVFNNPEEAYFAGQEVSGKVCNSVAGFSIDTMVGSGGYRNERREEGE